MIKCKFCGADNEVSDERCFSCNAPLPKRSNLNEKDKQNLSNYINGIENMLKAAKKKIDGKLFIFFFAISVFWLTASFLMYYFFKDNLILVIIFAVIFGFVLFVSFGGLISSLEEKAMETVFDRKIKNEIKEYLKAMHYTETDFKITASEVLKEKSPLNNFMADI